ncbi:MAG: hypothetical protein EBX41_11165 [Chitinophagia bacterium]|nr:hypothetical protein [Chitinophagia bacterium]
MHSNIDFSENAKALLADRELSWAVADAMRSDRRNEIYSPEGLSVTTPSGRKFTVREAKPELVPLSDKKPSFLMKILIGVYSFFTR